MHVLITAPSWENFCAFDWWQGFFSLFFWHLSVFIKLPTDCGSDLWSYINEAKSLIVSNCNTFSCVMWTQMFYNEWMCFGNRWEVIIWSFQMGKELEASPLLLTPHGYRRGSIDIRWWSIPSWKQPHRILIWDWTSRLWGTELCAGALNKSSNSLSVNSTPRLCFPTWLSRTEAFILLRGAFNQSADRDKRWM